MGGEGALGQDGGGEGDEKWSESGYILKAEPTRPTDETGYKDESKKRQG